MTSIFRSSIRLTSLGGVDLHFHCSWFLVAAFEIVQRRKVYSSPLWAVLEYLALFLSILLHEYGHALACRQVGGRANKILIWPFGGAAYVSPPMRPGATLWSFAAGPLVNFVLFATSTVILRLSHSLGWTAVMPNLMRLAQVTWDINLVLVVFNLLPVYPLDGGQILRSLLWFVVGRARSLMLTASIGFMGVAGFLTVAWWKRSLWFVFLSAIILTLCWTGLKQARMLLRLAKLPRHNGFSCSGCLAQPPKGNFWKCKQCNFAFDTFEAQAACPKCAARFESTQCVDCGKWQPLADWLIPARTVLTGEYAQCSPGNAQSPAPVHNFA